MGVSVFFFLPDLVATLTSADEFHSVTKTRWPVEASHFASRLSCVVLPDPSMPSTTNNRPGYAWGVCSVLIMGDDIGARASRAPGHYLEAYLTLEQFGQRLGVAFGHPALQI